MNLGFVPLVLLDLHQVLVFKVVRLKKFLPDESFEDLNFFLQDLNGFVDLLIFFDEIVLNGASVERTLVFFDSSDLEEQSVHLLF